MRLLLDENIPRRTVQALRALGHDNVSRVEAIAGVGRQGMVDLGFVARRALLVLALVVAGLACVRVGLIGGYEAWQPFAFIAAAALSGLAEEVARNTWRCRRRCEMGIDARRRLRNEGLMWVFAEALLCAAVAGLGLFVLGPPGVLLGLGLGFLSSAIMLSRRGVRCVRDSQIAWRAALTSGIFPRVDRAEALEAARGTVDHVLVPGFVGFGFILVATGVIFALAR
jgi:hypothetical protein